MSHPPCYTKRMKIKNDMKENNKANNLRLGAIYINAATGQPARLINIVSCQGAWLESYDGQGYGDTVKFEDVHYADKDEVQDYLEDYRTYTASEKAPSHKPVNYDTQWNVQGYYNDDNGNDIRCRD